jgi:hypothetical protein
MRLLGFLAALLLLVSGAAVPAEQPAATMNIERTSPSPGATLPRFGSYYIAVRYTTDRPLRIQARAYAHGTSLDAGQSMNGSALHPAPGGTALAWVGYDKPARIDEIRITAYDDAWRPLLVLRYPARVQWLAEPASTYHAPPGWAQALIDGERRIAAQEQPAGAAGFVGLAVGGLLIVGALPGYLVLQFLSMRFLDSGWRKAALVPLLLMALACLHAAYALSQDSNLWPIVVILTAPLACLYLAGLLGLRFLHARVLPG